jgi:hypothetical protein
VPTLVQGDGCKSGPAKSSKQDNKHTQFDSDDGVVVQVKVQQKFVLRSASGTVDGFVGGSSLATAHWLACASPESSPSRMQPSPVKP